MVTDRQIPLLLDRKPFENPERLGNTPISWLSPHNLQQCLTVRGPPGLFGSVQDFNIRHRPRQTYGFVNSVPISEIKKT